MGAFHYVAYRRWYAYVCGCVGAASNVGAGASVNIAPCCAGAPGFAPPVPGNFRYFRFLGGWGWGMPKKIGRLGLRESPWERVRERGFEWEREGRGIKSGGTKKRGATPPASTTNRRAAPRLISATSTGRLSDPHRPRNHHHRRNHRCTNRPAADPANPPAKNPPQTRHPAQP